MEHQGIFDNFNCGRFVLSYIENKVSGKETLNQENPQIANKFSDLDAKCNQHENSTVDNSQNLDFDDFEFTEEKSYTSGIIVRENGNLDMIEALKNKVVKVADSTEKAIDNKKENQIYKR